MVMLNFEIPDEILHSLGMSSTEFANKMRLYSALQFFKDRKLSLGKAAMLAGMEKVQFVLELDKFEIPLINYDSEELEQELAAFQEK